MKERFWFRVVIKLLILKNKTNNEVDERLSEPHKDFEVSFAKSM